MCETDFSGYPDCRDDTVKAMQLALTLGMDRRFVIHTPLMWIDKAATFALAQEIGGDALVDLLVEETHTCYLGDRSRRHVWGYGCGDLSGLPAAGGRISPNGRPNADASDKLEARRRREGIVFLVLFALTIPVANWLIGNAGTTCVPNGPCLIPVAPGLMAPSGVTMIGIALVLRDLVQRRLGVGVAVGAILAGAALSALVAPPSLVIASAAAFLLSEFADLAVYTPLARRRLVAAVVASSLVGLVVDSIVFLWLAFGSLEFLAGQVVGKAWMVLLSIPFVAWLRRRDERTGMASASHSPRGPAMSAALYDKLKNVTTGTITTMLLKKGIRRCWMQGPMPLEGSGRRIIGPAFTLRFIPVREDLATPESWAKPISTRGAIEDMPEGCIAVADAMGVTAPASSATSSPCA